MDIQLPFLFSATINASQKGKVSEMIETKAEVSKDLEKALQALEQAKQHVANEKKKQSEKKRKAQNHHKYIMGKVLRVYENSSPYLKCRESPEIRAIPTYKNF